MSKILIVSLLCVLCFSNLALGGQSYVIVTPTSLSQQDAEIVWSTAQSLIGGADPGDRVQVLDAIQHRRIADITVPDAPSAKARLTRIKREIASLGTMLRAAPENPGDQRATDVPGCLALIGAGMWNADEPPIRIILVGSLFHSGADESMSFTPGQYPSDGHLLATSRESVFGCADRKGSLEGVIVHWCTLTDEGTPLERRAVERFWTIYIAELGGTLASCSPGPELVVERALNGASSSISADTIDRQDTEVAIRTVRRAAPQTNEEPAPVALPETPPAERLQEAAKVLPAARAGFCTIAAVWTSQDGQADVDLWVRPAPGSKELNFQATESPEGRYLRDIRVAQHYRDNLEWKATWECVEVRAAALDRPTCYLNLYRNSGADVDGIVRIQLGERTTNIPFRFSGMGDEADGRHARDTSSSWVKIDLAAGLAAN